MSKSKHQSRKQQKRHERQRTKASSRPKERSARMVPARDEVIQDMAPFFDVSGSPSRALQELMTTLLDSGDLIDEPELEAILIEPMLCADTFALVGEGMGLTPEKLAALPPEEQDDVHIDILEQSIGRILSEKICQDILVALNALRLRLRQSDRKEEAARVAALQSFLREDINRASWPLIGLVQAIFQKSLDAGFRLIDASSTMLGIDDWQQGKTGLLDRILHSETTPEMEKLVAQVPGLNAYLQKQTDMIWHEGVQAVRSGELYLGVYSGAEIRQSFAVIVAALGYDSVEAMSAAGASLGKVSKDEVRLIFEGLEAYIRDLFTLERLQQLRVQIDGALHEAQDDKKWLPFKVLLREYLKDEQAVESEMAFLVSALFGELGVLAKEEAQREGHRHRT